MKMIYGDKMDAGDCLREFEPYELNMRCLTSLKWHVAHKSKAKEIAEKRGSHMFKSRERHEVYQADRTQTEV
jgi:hypothetical protein